MSGFWVPVSHILFGGWLALSLGPCLLLWWWSPAFNSRSEGFQNFASSVALFLPGRFETLRWTEICQQKRGGCVGVSRMRSRLVDGSSPWKGDLVLKGRRDVIPSPVIRGETSASVSGGGFSRI
ncbi:hypothetical protein YC2023_054094 [Brassica napus]